MRIGTATRRITPRAGSELCGFVARAQPSTGIHDDLFAKVLLLRSGGATVLWIHCDLVGFSNKLACGIRREVADRLGVGIDSVLLSATHTHAGPATVALRNCGAVDPAYLDFLKAEILGGAVEATASMEDVSPLYAETVLEGITLDRRAASENSHVDNHLPVIAFARGDGSLAAVVTNFAVHNVGFSSDNRLISADIAGFAAARASARLPGGPMVLVANGGCGNIHPARREDGRPAVESVGSALGDCVAGLIPRLEPSRETGLRALFSVVELPVETVSLAKLDAMMDDHEKSFQESSRGYVDTRIHEAMRAWYEETRRLIENGAAPATVEAYVHILKIGPAVFIGINAEVFSVMAERLRKNIGMERLFVVGYANGCVGYLPPSEVYAEGGYEVDLAYKFYGNFMLKAGAFEIIQKKTEEMLASIENS